MAQQLQIAQKAVTGGAGMPLRVDNIRQASIGTIAKRNDAKKRIPCICLYKNTDA